MDELFGIVFQLVVIVEMFDSMWQYEFGNCFQFVLLYHEHFVQIPQNDYETIYEFHINAQFHEAKKRRKLYHGGFF